MKKHNKNHKTTFFFIIILSLLMLSCIIAYADESYKIPGGSDNDYYQGLNTITESTALQPYSSNINNRRQLHYLYSDLNNDTYTEIVYKDGNSIYVLNYTGTGYEPVSSYSTGAGNTSNMIIFDEDGDGLEEIIIYNLDNRYMYFLNYSDGVLDNETQYLMGLTADSGFGYEAAIACADTNECLITYTNSSRISILDDTASLKAAIFDSTGAPLLYTNQHTEPANSGGLCMPRPLQITVLDDNNDGVGDRYAYNVVEYDRFGSKGDIELFYHTVGNLVAVGVTSDADIDVTASEIDNTGRYSDGTDCYGMGIGELFTPLTAGDFHSSTGKDTVFGYMYDFEVGRMMLYDGSATPERVKTYPNSLGVVGSVGVTSISNCFKASIYDNDNQDFCCSYYDTDQDELKFSCASSYNNDGSLIPNDNLIITYDYAGSFNLTASVYHDEGLVHSVKDSAGDAISGFVTPYGLIRPDETDGSSSDASLIKSSGLSNSLIQPVGADGFNDWLAASSTVLYYIDDSFSNSPPTITYTLDPCAGESVVKVNTSIQVSIDAEDPDNDPVSCRAIAYYGSTNQHDSGWGINQTGSFQAAYLLEANKTANNIILRVECYDDETVDSPESLESVFSVGTKGVEFGDCESEFSNVVEGDADDDGAADTDLVEEDIDQNDNAIINALNDDAIKRSGLTPSVLWIIIMVFVAYGLWTGSTISESYPGISMGIIIMVELMMTVLGFYLGFFGIGSILLFVVIGIIIIGIWTRNVFTGTGQT